MCSFNNIYCLKKKEEEASASFALTLLPSPIFENHSSVKKNHPP
jgi:hypothetical protein